MAKQGTECQSARAGSADQDRAAAVEQSALPASLPSSCRRASKNENERLSALDLPPRTDEPGSASALSTFHHLSLARIALACMLLSAKVSQGNNISTCTHTERPPILYDGPQTPTPPEEAKHYHPAPWRRSAQRTRPSDEAIPRSFRSLGHRPTSHPPRNAASISDCSEDSAVSSCDWQDKCRLGLLQSSAAMFADCVACLSSAAKDM